MIDKCEVHISRFRVQVAFPFVFYRIQDDHRRILEI